MLSLYLSLKPLLQYTAIAKSMQERVLRVEGFFVILKALSSKKNDIPSGVVYLPYL